MEDLRGGGIGVTGDTDEGGMGTGGKPPSGKCDWWLVSILGHVFEGKVKGREAYGGGIDTP